MTQLTKPGILQYRHLKLRHLELLQLLHEVKSITRASEQLHLTQSATSSMLKELEAIFGVVLVKRGARGVELTPAGITALRRFAMALREIESAREEAVLIQEHGGARLRVGALSLAMVTLIPRTLCILLRDSPAIKIEITEGTVAGLTDAFLVRELDCIVGRLGRISSLDSEGVGIQQLKLYDEPRCFISRYNHPCYSNALIDLPSLARESWILPPAPFSTRLAFDKLFLAQGLIPPSPVIESHNAHSNMDIVAATNLLGTVPRSLAQRHFQTRNLSMISAPFYPDSIPISLIWRTSEPPLPALFSFRNALKKILKQRFVIKP
ncbi:MAG: LysR substrate-binding domain-containing protein [Castellaniella sp.]